MFDEGFPENVRYSVYGSGADDTMRSNVLSIVLSMTSAPWTQIEEELAVLSQLLMYDAKSWVSSRFLWHSFCPPTKTHACLRFHPD